MITIASASTHLQTSPRDQPVSYVINVITFGVGSVAPLATANALLCKLLSLTTSCLTFTTRH